jgi:uncharacterized membrane protein YgaE (UPF0421/DUF939 family)
MLKLPARQIDAFVFSSKAALSAVVAVLCFGLFGLPGTVWAAVSAVIVTQPSLHPSVKASATRVVANLIGAFCGAVLGALMGQTLLSLALGVLITGLICQFTNLEDALRPAYAAVVIVIYTSDTSKWYGSLDRVLAVMIGCLAALAVGFLLDKAAIGLGLGRKDNITPGGFSE